MPNDLGILRAWDMRRLAMLASLSPHQADTTAAANRAVDLASPSFPMLPPAASAPDYVGAAVWSAPSHWSKRPDSVPGVAVVSEARGFTQPVRLGPLSRGSPLVDTEPLCLDNAHLRAGILARVLHERDVGAGCPPGSGTTQQRPPGQQRGYLTGLGLNFVCDRINLK